MQITDKNHIFLIGVIGFLFIVSHAADRKKNLTRAQINALVKPIKSYLLKQILIDEESEFSIASKSILPTDFTVKTACYSDDAMRLIIVYENGKIAFYTFNPTTHLFSQNDGPKIDMGAKKQSNLDNLYSFAAISGNGKYIALIPQFKKEAKVKGIYHGDWNLTLSSFLVDLNAINIQIVLNYLGDLCQINCNIDKKPTFIVTNFAEVSKYSQYIGSISKQSTCFLTTQLTQKNNTFMGQVTAILFALNQNNIIFNAYFESYKDAQLSPNGSLLAVLNASQLSICPIDHTFNRSTEELVTKVNFLDKLQDNNISIDFIDDSYIITKNKKNPRFLKSKF